MRSPRSLQIRITSNVVIDEWYSVDLFKQAVCHRLLTETSLTFFRIDWVLNDNSGVRSRKLA